MSGDADQAITTTNRQRLAWLGEVNRYRSEQTRLQQRIAAVDAKTYQAADTLAKSATALQQPLLHTFDRSKATKPSRTAWP